MTETTINFKNDFHEKDWTLKIQPNLGANPTEIIKVSAEGKVTIHPDICKQIAEEVVKQLTLGEK